MKSRLKKTIEALRKNGFGVKFFEDRKKLISKIKSYIKDYQNIGVGGSVTLTELGIISLLEKEKKNIIYHGLPGLTPGEKENMRIKQLTCDLFLTSANAITEKGQIVNRDSIGNRICASVFGPKKILIVAGENKIVKDLKAGLERIKKVSAPLNAKRLNLNTPCVKKGICQDCDSEERICRITMITEKKPKYSDIEVFFIKGNFGF